MRQPDGHVGEHPSLRHNTLLADLEARGLADDVLVVVNLDPRHPQEGVTVIPAALGLPPAFTVRDLLADENHAWRIGLNYVRLDPGQSHVLHVRR